METHHQRQPAALPPTSVPTSNATDFRPPLRRACDCCRKRKVKCDGTEPCTPCKKASIRCAYLQPPKKKGPKGLRSAKVLHALRRIDDDARQSPPMPLGFEQHGAFGDWGWGNQAGSPNASSYPNGMQPPGSEIRYEPPTSAAPTQSYSQQQSSPQIPYQSKPQPSPAPMSHPPLYRQDSSNHDWPTQSELSSSGPAFPNATRSIAAGSMPQRVPGERFLPYVQLFFDHMFPIMPVIDRSVYLDPVLYTDTNALTPDMYCLLCALCAATIVQLDASISQPPSFHSSMSNKDVFVEECLRERKAYDYIENASTLSVMITFFLFAYYGNIEKHAKAWHYLQESITVAENLNLDDEASYANLDPVDAQWRRRLYWLLFITERAYAVQRRKNVRLHANVQLPAVFDSEDPLLLNGFVNLANLFSAVDDSFVSAWKGSRRQSLCNEAWLAKTQKQLDVAALALDNVSETQHLDISITREWLHVLAWQMGVSNGLIWGQGQDGMRLDYPIELARRVVEITSGANALALDSHGIGMEQKLADIAGCLADVLRCAAGDTSPTFQQGKQYLKILMQQLSSIRGKESRYLQPLLAKMEGLMGFELNSSVLRLPNEVPASFPVAPNDFLTPGPRFSIADSVGMLRTLSMSGNLGMPNLMMPHEDWQQRRPSGRVYDEAETKSMDAWLLSNGPS